MAALSGRLRLLQVENLGAAAGMVAVHVELVDLAAEVFGLTGGEDGLVGAAHRPVLAQRGLLLG